MDVLISQLGTILHFHRLFHLQVYNHLTVTLLVSSGVYTNVFYVFLFFFFSLIHLSSFNNFSFIYHLLQILNFQG